MILILLVVFIISFFFFYGIWSFCEDTALEIFMRRHYANIKRQEVYKDLVLYYESLQCSKLLKG